MDLKGKSVGILGMARSGVAAARLVKTQGGTPFVSDNASAERLAKAIVALKALDIDFETDHHSADALRQQDLVVISPGVPINNPLVVELIEAGVEVISELELAARLLPCPMIAVTGTNGKSTTVALIAYVLTTAGIKNAVAGNIGNPLSDAVSTLTPNAWAVVEVSSFQLEAAPTFHPKVSAILNVTPDHLERHGTFENYLALKQRIFQHQTGNDILVYNSGDPVVTGAVSSAKCSTKAFSLQSQTADVAVDGGQVVIREKGSTIAVLEISDIEIPGAHNVENVLAAVACTASIGVDSRSIRDGVASFVGIEHRLETVGTFRGVTWVNDSKSTNAQSGIIALNAMPPPIVLLAGGRAKAEDYSRLIPYFADRVRSVIAFGEAGPMLEKTWQNAVDLHRAVGLYDAVRLAAEIASQGDTVLLSPMGSSFDQFEDFEQRGRRFKQWIDEYYTREAQNS